MTDPTYQMLWHCAQCETRDLLALTQRYCPNCGTAQDADNRYFPEEGKEVAVENHHYVGADWPCAYCEAPNSAASAFCTHCGGPREGKAEVKRVQDGEASKVSPPALDSSTPVKAASLSGTPNYGAVATKNPGLGFLPWIGLLLVGALLFGAYSGLAGLVGLFTKHDETALVIDQQWSRSVTVEQFAAATDSAWCDQLPAGAYQVSRFKEQRSTRQVEDGQVCQTVRQDQGDGTFTKRRECETRWRSEPVYADRCKYQINRWRFERSDVLQGNALQSPSWPMPQLGSTLVPGAVPTLGAQRLGTQSERYVVKLRSQEGEEWSCNLPEAQWASMQPNTRVQLKVRSIGGAVCDSLERVQ